MDDSQEKDSSPKYMNLGQMSQYEISEWLDSKAREADQKIHSSGNEAGLELVLCQLADHIQDVFGIGVQPDMAFGDLGRPTFDHQVATFMRACAKAFIHREGETADIHRFRMLMRKAMRSSFQDSKDIMKMQQPWGYEIQTRLEKTQGRVEHGIAHFTF